MWRKCVFTELTLMPSISPTSGFEKPFAASWMMESSRAERLLTPCRISNILWMSSGMYRPPEAISLTAFAISAGRESFGM